MNLLKLKQLAKRIRYYILLVTTSAGSGHTSSSLSAVELMTALFFQILRADLENPDNPANDRVIFSKGHASPLFYALYAAAGKITEKDLVRYRTFDSVLEGHPTMRFRYTEAPTGSLGQGLPIGVGMALSAKYITHIPYRTYVLLGDGEMAEGSVWEAIQLASYYKLDNLVGILDVNRLGQSQETMFGHHLSEEYVRRIESFGWSTVTVNGHSFPQILKAFAKVTKMKDGKPKMIIAKTYKGYGISMLQNKDGWHGKPLPKDLYERAVKELGKVDFLQKGDVKKPTVSSIKYEASRIKKDTNRKAPKIHYTIGESVATRQSAGDTLTDLMYRYPEIVVLDGDVKNSLYTERTQKEHPDRYFEMFIAEQNMTGAAIGLWRRGSIPFVTTFAAFMTRAYDQIRMSALAGANIKFIGSHAGVSIGEDGASQMGLEDLSMFRSIWGSTVLYPADAVSTAALMEETVRKDGIVYIRVGRPATPVMYQMTERFPIGGSKVHLATGATGKSRAVIVAAGVTLYEALSAQSELAKEGIVTTVIDCYCVKPIDEKTLKSLGANIPLFITVEDHWFEGGIGDAVLNVFAQNPKVDVVKLAVVKFPRSGKPQELLDFVGISKSSIIHTVKRYIK